MELIWGATMRKSIYFPLILGLSACGGSNENAPSDPQKAASTATCSETSPGDLEISLPFAMRCYTESEYAKAVLIWKELEKSEGEAKWGIGKMYSEGFLGTPKPSTINGQRIAWDEFYPNSDLNTKDGNVRDNRVAKTYYEEALKMGYKLAGANLGEMYYFSKWVNDDVIVTERRDFYCNRHNMRNAESMTSETCKKAHEEIISRAWGVKKDINAAISNYTIAANIKYAPASYALGIIYSSGEEVDQNIEKAIFFYREAAVNGEADAIWNLSINYGHDTPNKDFVKSYALAVVAHSSVGTRTRDPVRVIETAMARLSISDLKRAEDMISDCIVDYDKSQPNRGNYKVNFESCEF
jgi:TPR repeat protein